MPVEQLALNGSTNIIRDGSQQVVDFFCPDQTCRTLVGRTVMVDYVDAVYRL